MCNRRWSVTSSCGKTGGCGGEIDREREREKAEAAPGDVTGPDITSGTPRPPRIPNQLGNVIWPYLQLHRNILPGGPGLIRSMSLLGRWYRHDSLMFVGCATRKLSTPRWTPIPTKQNGFTPSRPDLCCWENTNYLGNYTATHLALGNFLSNPLTFCST